MLVKYFYFWWADISLGCTSLVVINSLVDFLVLMKMHWRKESITMASFLNYFQAFSSISLSISENWVVEGSISGWVNI